MLHLPQEYLIYAILASLVPTFFWLWFWSKRDRFCPEPRIHLFGAFIFGAFAALFTLPLQAFVAALFGISSIISMLLFVCAEETIKYSCSWYNALRNNPYCNERIDPIIYLATTALGFAFLENALYFLRYMNDFSLDIATLEGGKRVVGATVLHMTTSAIVGVCIAIVFFKARWVRWVATTVGICLAIGVHIGFNYLVTHTEADLVLLAFAGTWLLFTFVLIALEILRAPTCREIDWEEYNT